MAPRLGETGTEVAKHPLQQYPAAVLHTGGRVGFWLHPDDLAPEIGPLSALIPTSIAAGISDLVYRERYRLSDQRIESLHIVLRDGLSRASAHYACPSVAIETDDPVQGLCAWARGNVLSEVVAFAPMVGPVHDMLPRLKAGLESMGIPLTLLRRQSDTTAFSFATSGFFPFWEKMSLHLKQLQLRAS